MNNYVIGFDPGFRTGFAVLRVLDFKTRSYVLEDHKTIEWNNRVQCKQLLAHYHSIGYIQVVVIEDFKLYASKAEALIHDYMPSPRVIERIVVACEDLGIDAKCRFPMAKELYKESGVKWPIPENDLKCLDKRYDHEKDAYLHARVWLLKNGRKVKVNA